MLTGTPGDNDIGTHPVSLIVTDGKEFITQNFNIQVRNVNDPPQITGQDYLETDEDTSFALSKDQLEIEDSDSDPGDITLNVLSGENYILQGNNTIIPDQDFSGTLAVNTRATDLTDQGDIYQVSLVVKPVNDPPVILGQKISLSVKQMNPLDLLIETIDYRDVDNNINDLSIEVLPDPDTIYSYIGNQVTPVKDTVGPIDVRIILNDGEDISEEFLLQVNVLAPFSPPKFTSEPPMQAIVDRVYFYVVHAEDPDEGDELEYSPGTLPDWLDFNTDLKLLGGNPSVGDTGIVWVGIEVTDGKFIVEQLYQLEVRLATGMIDRTVEYSDGSGLIRQIYPVPARDIIHLSLIQGKSFTVQVLDASGKVCVSIPQRETIESKVDIDLSGYSPGVYFIRVFNGSKSDSRKVIINR
ncbi:MAG: T9SS type A sorting domain-containing protein [Bacteroidales bacterium]|nr:T9SS type A sorting domain-containing protein [Bacteroidales bacterium]